MRDSVESLLQECLEQLPAGTRKRLTDIEAELLANAADIDRTRPADALTALYDLVVQQTSLRSNVKEFSELQNLVALLVHRGKKPGENGT